MFSSGPNYSKLKTNLRLAINRLKLLQKKKAELTQKSRKEIADYISNNKCERARIRVEHIIREDYLVEAMEFVEMYCDLLLARFGLISQTQNLDEGLSEAISSVLWVAPRLQADVPEMKMISDMLTAKYGKPYAEACRKGSVPTIPERIQHKMSIQSPPALLVEKYLIEIAKNYNIEFKPDPQVMKEDQQTSGVDALLDLNDSDTNNLGGGQGPPQPAGFVGFPQPPMLPSQQSSDFQNFNFHSDHCVSRHSKLGALQAPHSDNASNLPSEERYPDIMLRPPRKKEAKENETAEERYRKLLNDRKRKEEAKGNETSEEREIKLTNNRKREVAADSQRFTGVYYRAGKYSATRLPMGHALALALLQKIMMEAIEAIEEVALDLKGVTYLDDILFYTPHWETLEDIPGLLQSMGFTINEGKSSNTPLQTLIYLGLIVDSTGQTLTMTEDAQARARVLLNHLRATNAKGRERIAGYFSWLGHNTTESIVAFQRLPRKSLASPEEPLDVFADATPWAMASIAPYRQECRIQRFREPEEINRAEMSAALLIVL
uniref:IST1 homolog n=1 Tax=Timema monikensis TaxID=170555 RepID=A0A7R9HSY1_9NEOP|nr:unnamed protein product [Timema monikensis]